MLDVYEFCSNDLKKQLDGPRVAVREEEDRKANKDRAAKKAKMVSSFLQALPCIVVVLGSVAAKGKP